MMQIRVLPFLLVAGLLSACGENVPAPRAGRDLTVLASPDKRFEAVVRELDIGGSVGVSQPYQVLVRSLVLEPGQHVVVLTADRTEGLRIRWSQVGELEVCFDRAHIHGFRNNIAVVGKEPNQIEQAEVLLVKRKSLLECAKDPSMA